MYEIAIVEDSRIDRMQICEYLERFFKTEIQKEYRITEFQGAIPFLSNYKPVYDVVLLDIQMPDLDGIEAAKRLREMDAKVPLAFITNLSGCAVQGYSVNAADFIVKPVQYAVFRVMLRKLLTIADNLAKQILIKTAEGMVRLDVNSIHYIDVLQHRVTYHTDSGPLPIWSSLKEEQAKLPADCFAKVNHYTLINFRFVQEIQGSDVRMRDGTVIALSQSKKAGAIQAYLAYCGKYL